MQYHPAIFSNAVSHLRKLLNLDCANDPTPDVLHQQLSGIVQRMLHSDLGRLLHILYRIDVEERLVKQAMQATSEREISEQLAHLIIERELQKAWTRSIYRHN